MSRSRSHSPSVVALANDAPVLSADVIPGHMQIGLANEARLEAATFSQGLTAYTVDWVDPEALLPRVDYIAPPIPVARRFDWKKADNSEAFLIDTDDERTIGSDFKRVEYSGSSQTGKTISRGLSIVLDKDEDGGATTEQQLTAKLLQRIIRSKYKRAMTALAAIAAGTAKTWSSGTPKPDEEMKAELAAAQLDSGLMPNRGLIGLAAWNYRSSAMSGQATAGAFAGLAKSAAQVAGDLMLDDLRVDKALYQSTATAKTRIVGSSFYGFLGYDGLSKDDPSHLKQFYTPTEGGRYRVFRREFGPGGMFIEVTVIHYETIIATSTKGLARLNIT